MFEAFSVFVKVSNNCIKYFLRFNLYSAINKRVHVYKLSN